MEEEKYCVDILTQVSVLTNALHTVALGLVDDHLKHCVLDAARAGGDEADAKIKEATDAIARLVRSWDLAADRATYRPRRTGRPRWAASFSLRASEVETLGSR